MLLIAQYFRAANNQATRRKQKKLGTERKMERYNFKWYLNFFQNQISSKSKVK
jgi:hypothetical protein